MTQPQLLNVSVIETDVVYTPDHIARDIVAHFKPTGVVLDPCRGDDAFYKYLPAGALWCEIENGRDFFSFTDSVDWIVGNPPYSVFSEWLRHSFEISDNVVYLIPINKPFNSDKMIREVYEYGGIKEVFVISGGGALGFPIGFACGAVHFRRGYKGGIDVTFWEAA